MHRAASQAQEQEVRAALQAAMAEAAARANALVAEREQETAFREAAQEAAQISEAEAAALRAASQAQEQEARDALQVAKAEAAAQVNALRDEVTASREALSADQQKVAQIDQDLKSEESANSDLSYDEDAHCLTCFEDPHLWGMQHNCFVANSLVHEEREPEHLSIAICGHGDSGKSTTTGRLFVELGGLPIRELEGLQQEAERLGKGSATFAFLCNNMKEERERRVTFAGTTKEFVTEKLHYTIIDTLGEASLPEPSLMSEAKVQSEEKVPVSQAQ